MLVDTNRLPAVEAIASSRGNCDARNRRMEGGENQSR